MTTSWLVSATSPKLDTVLIEEEAGPVPRRFTRFFLTRQAEGDGNGTQR